MPNLWAPWRIEYVTHPGREGCFLCTALAQAKAPAALVLALRERVFVVLNKYPYTAGHLMVVPNRHVAGLDDLAPEELADLLLVGREMCALLGRVMRPHGFNLGLNLGRPAGAGLEEHLHLHVVPRWSGDTNFMPVLDGVTVVPEALAATAAKLREALEAPPSPGAAPGGA